MDFIQLHKDTITYALTIAIIIFAMIYLLPFILPPFLKLFRFNWGYINGRRNKHKHLKHDALYNLAPKGDSERKVPDESGSETRRNKFIQEESSYLDGKIRLIEEELAQTQRKIDEINNVSIAWRKSDLRNIANKSFAHTTKVFNREMGKNVFLMFLIGFFLIIDAIIARHVLRTLGLYVQDGYLFDISGFIALDYPLIYGLFFTLTTSFLLHLLWPRKVVGDFIKQGRHSIFWAGGAILALFFVVRLAMVLLPESLMTFLSEILVLACWVIGVFIVYWLVGEVVGDDSDWFRLMIAFSAPLIVVLVILFGTLSLLQIFAEWLVTAICMAWFRLRKARVLKQKRNINEGKLANINGFYHGFDV